uniref:hypothetical protein n=1 Tax=Nocardia suismassiliense TaxID=2077092 RepID=UPI003F498E9F
MQFTRLIPRHSGRHRSGRFSFISASVLAIMLLTATTVGAQPGPAPDTPQQPPGPSLSDQDLPPEMVPVPGAGKQCVDTALARKVDNWVCIGALLVTPQGQEVLPVVPRPDLVEPVPGPDPQSRSADDYDIWCEPDSSSPCIREISQYQSEAKSNLIYGDEDGVIGTFDWVIRLNLNGRSAIYTVTIIHDEGPSLNFIRNDVHCREVVPGPLPDTSCGIHYMGSPFTVTAVDRRFNYGPVQGSRLDDAGTYFAEGRVQFHPEGEDYVYSIPSSALQVGPQSERFVCPTEDRNCYFNR